MRLEHGRDVVDALVGPRDEEGVLLAELGLLRLDGVPPGAMNMTACMYI